MLISLTDTSTEWCHYILPITCIPSLIFWLTCIIDVLPDAVITFIISGIHVCYAVCSSRVVKYIQPASCFMSQKVFTLLAVSSVLKFRIIIKHPSSTRSYWSKKLILNIHSKHDSI